MLRRSILALILLGTSACALFAPSSGPLVVDSLRAADLDAPLALWTAAPRLSWQVATTAPARRDQGTTAFEVQVASSADALAAGRADLWDRGWQTGPDVVAVDYAGAPLASGARAWWRVRVRDRDGRASPWSAPAQFGVGLLRAADWRGDWIGAPDAAGGEGHEHGRTRAPWLRRTLDLAAAPRRALLHVASIGYHEAWCNGNKLGDAELAPSVSDLSERVRAVTYDVSDHLRAGSNCVGLWLGAGWSRYPRYGVPAGPLVRAQLEIELADGSARTVATDPSWRTRPSHVEAIGGSDFGNYGGERVDAGADLPGWSTPELDDAAWTAASTFATDVAIVPDAVEPNRRVAELRPVTIEERRPGVWRVDMGRAFTGITEARLRGAPGAVVQLSFAERDGQDATYAQRSELVLGPDGTGTFRHRFNYTAARWITIEGAERPEPADVRGYLVRSGYGDAGSFACDDPLLQQIHDTVRWTFECLSLGGYVVDCAHRERWGYGGDAHATMETALSSYDLGAFYGKWLDDWAAIQNEYGNLPFTCPTYRGGGGPAWSGIVVMLPWEVYRRTADIGLLERAWPTIERWLGFLDDHTEDGILQFYFDERYTRDVYSFLGDWVPPGGVQAGGVPGDDVPGLERKFFNNAYRVWAVRTAAQIAAALGRDADAARLRTQADELAAAVHARFFDAERGVHVTARQTYYALPLLAGVGPDAVRDDLWTRLVDDVTERGHVDTGIHGTWFLVKLLLARGRADLLQTVASQRDDPSWGHMLDQGATTMWEQWDGINSRMHSSFLSIGAFFTEGLLGIRPTDDAPGYARFEVAPAIGFGGLTRAEGHLDTVHGRIACSWQVDGERVELALGVPVGTTAVIHLAAARPGSVDEGAVAASRAPGVRDARDDAQGFRCEVGSGSYRFTFARAAQEPAVTASAVTGAR